MYGALFAIVMAAGATALFAQEYRATAGVRIHASQRDYIGSVSSAVKLTNGNIVIADNSNLQLHFFSATGVFIRSIGRAGSGPAEFQAVRWVGECARDSVFAFDNMQNVISVFDANGKYVRSFSPPVPQTVMMRCGVDGTIAYVIAGARVGTTSRGGMQTYSSAGKLLYRSGDIFLDEGRPLGKSIKFSIADNTLIFGDGENADVMLSTAAGTSRRKVSTGLAGRAPTDANRAGALVYWTKYLGRPADYEVTRRYLISLPPVTVLPAYSDLFIDDISKAAWIQTSVLGDPNTVLERVGLDGVSQGRVTLMPNLIIQQIRGDVVVAKNSDAITGAESVLTWKLTGPGR